MNPERTRRIVFKNCITSTFARTRKLIRARALTPLVAAGLLLPSFGAAAQSTSEYRTYDGYGNNLANPLWGTPDTHLSRDASGTHYADGLSTLAGPARPSARVVSNAVFEQRESLPNEANLTDFIWAWGQFVDHDLSLTEGLAEPAPISIPQGDPFFDPAGAGQETMPFNRAIFDPQTGQTTPRQQINQITGYLDGSQVYGSDAARATWLRTFVGGRLHVSSSAQGDMLPYNDGTQLNAGDDEANDFSTDLFVAGDIRANEQPTLAALHVLFVREHNWQADRIAAENPSLSDEEIFQRARRIVIAELQRITYHEFLPALLGDEPLPEYTGYDDQVDVTINATFSTAAYRLGHTLLSPTLLRLEADGSSIPAGPLALRDAFFDATPTLLTTDGLEPYFRGLVAQLAQRLDAKVIDDVRNFLFGPPGAGGFDLVALNIQRGRDMGLPDFNTVRQDYGLQPYTSFADISSDPDLVTALQNTYADVDDIDAFVGLLAEDDVPGAIMGETLRAVLVDQFVRTRDGDRFWHQATLSGQELGMVMSTRLSDIIERNTGIQQMQKNVFKKTHNP